MTNKTWVGGDGNNANDAANWSPGDVPQPGDTLDMQAGTMNVRDNDLAGNALVIGKPNLNAAPVTLNLSHHANVSLDIAQFSTDPVTVNVAGTDTLNLKTEFPSSGHFTVNLADHARLTGGMDLIFSSAVFAGGSGSRFINNVSSIVQGSSVTIDTDVKGHGDFAVRSAQSVGGRLEFGGAVSYGQTVEVSGDPGRLISSRVQIDQPDAFKGSVALNLFGEVDLAGLSNADSFQLKNDILSIYSGCDVIDRLRLTTPAPAFGSGYDVTVAQTATGIVVDRGGFHGGGTLLPSHDGSGGVHV